MLSSVWLLWASGTHLEAALGQMKVSRWRVEAAPQPPEHHRSLEEAVPPSQGPRRTLEAAVLSPRSRNWEEAVEEAGRCRKCQT